MSDYLNLSLDEVVDGNWGLDWQMMLEIEVEIEDRLRRLEEAIDSVGIGSG